MEAISKFTRNERWQIGLTNYPTDLSAMR